ncbi:hypothetical protein [Nostoc sp. NMS4]|uniref:hypothetical protein n=1 Tax=Nostoc sp. NMS4 TaxID=2815390 RepID=UPI0025DD40C2|nr:hypothetical protein [Nostoc sp. NMS4]MBN3925454.1 hypothetical protein [Nostoc sp. NMS4]
MTKSPLTKPLVSTSTISCPRILIITSCTGKKLHNPTNQLTIEDFKDTGRLRERTELLSEFSCPSVQMYTGSRWSPVSYTYSRVGCQKQMAQVGSRGGRISILGLWVAPGQFRVCLGSRWV